MISSIVCVGSLWLWRWNVHLHYVFTSHFVHIPAGSAPWTCEPVIAAIATSVRYPIATSGLAHTVSKKPQDNKHRPRWSRNVGKRRTHRCCRTTKWLWSLVVAGRRVTSQLFDIVLPEHKVQDLGQFPTSTPDTPKQDFWIAYATTTTFNKSTYFYHKTVYCCM